MMININTDVTQFTLYCYIYYMHNSVESYRNSKEKNYLASIAALKKWVLFGANWFTME